MKPLSERPLIAGFSDFQFGEKYDDLAASKKLRARCKGRPVDLTRKKEFPSQSFEPKVLLCDALIADRYANMQLAFDHEGGLYEIEFSFRTSFSAALDGSRVRELTGEDVNKFVADVRAVLESSLGPPIDDSSVALGDRTIRLEWPGRTEDMPAHESRVNLRLSTGLASFQYVQWIDVTREAAMKSQIESERTESIRQKGL